MSSPAVSSLISSLMKSSSEEAPDPPPPPRGDETPSVLSSAPSASAMSRWMGRADAYVATSISSSSPTLSSPTDSSSYLAKSTHLSAETQSLPPTISTTSSAAAKVLTRRVTDSLGRAEAMPPRVAARSCSASASASARSCRVPVLGTLWIDRPRSVSMETAATTASTNVSRVWPFVISPSPFTGLLPP